MSSCEARLLPHRADEASATTVDDVGMDSAPCPCTAARKEGYRADPRRLASRWKEDMAFLRSFYVADDIWRFA